MIVLITASPISRLMSLMFGFLGKHFNVLQITVGIKLLVITPLAKTASAEKALKIIPSGYFVTAVFLKGRFIT